MSQHDMTITNQTASAARTDLNNALQALASTSSGGSAPSPTFANQLWYDTTNNILKQRNEANSAWCNLLYIDQTSNIGRILDDTQVVNTSGTQTGLLGDQSTATWQTGTGTTQSLVSPANVKSAILALAPSPALSLSSTQDTTSGSTVDFTGIPSTATEINVYFINFTHTGTGRVQLRVGGSVVSSGYNSSSGTSGAESSATDGMFIYNDSTTRPIHGIMTFIKAASDTWVQSHSLALGVAECNGGGSVTGIGTVDGIRVKATGTFSAGKISIGWR